MKDTTQNTSQIISQIPVGLELNPISSEELAKDVDILSGKKAYDDMGSLIVGAMPKRSDALETAPYNLTRTLSDGYYSNLQIQGKVLEYNTVQNDPSKVVKGNQFYGWNNNTHRPTLFTGTGKPSVVPLWSDDSTQSLKKPLKSYAKTTPIASASPFDLIFTINAENLSDLKSWEYIKFYTIITFAQLSTRTSDKRGTVIIEFDLNKNELTTKLGQTLHAYGRLNEIQGYPTENQNFVFGYHTLNESGSNPPTVLYKVVAQGEGYKITFSYSNWFKLNYGSGSMLSYHANLMGYKIKFD